MLLTPKSEMVGLILTGGSHPQCRWVRNFVQNCLVTGYALMSANIGRYYNEHGETYYGLACVLLDTG